MSALSGPSAVRLTDPMRAVLVAATKAGPTGLRRKHKPGPGQPPWPSIPGGTAHPATLRALQRHGLLQHQQILNRDDIPVDVWTATDTAAEALNPPPRQRADRPRYLQRDVWRGGDYTTERRHAIDDLETLDAEGLGRPEAQARHRAAKTPKQRAAHLRRAAA